MNRPLGSTKFSGLLKSVYEVPYILLQLTKSSIPGENFYWWSLLPGGGMGI